MLGKVVGALVGGVSAGLSFVGRPVSRVMDGGRDGVEDRRTLGNSDTMVGRKLGGPLNNRLGNGDGSKLGSFAGMVLLNNVGRSD